MNQYFWRTHSQKEIDLLEESGGGFDAFEFKFGKAKVNKAFLEFSKAYSMKNTIVITPDNLEGFIT